MLGVVVMLILNTLMHHAKVLLVRIGSVLIPTAGSSLTVVVLTRAHLIYHTVTRKVVLLILQNWRQVGVLVSGWVRLLGR